MLQHTPSTHNEHICLLYRLLHVALDYAAIQQLCTCSYKNENTI